MNRIRTAVSQALAAVRRLGPWTVRIPAPYPIRVRRTGLGAEINVEPLVRALLIELAQDSPDEDAEMAAIRDASGPCRDRLVEDLIDRLGGATIRVGATDAHLLAETIVAAAGPRVLQFPTQRTNRRAA